MRSVLLVLAVLLSLHWAMDTYEALRSGTYGLPVQVSLELRETIDDENADSLRVLRVSPRGNTTPLSRFGSTTDWVSPKTWFRDLRIEMPAERVSDIRRVRVELGERVFEFTGTEVEQEFQATTSDSGRVQLSPPRTVRAASSMLPTFADVINWPGDGVVGMHMLLQGDALRLLLLAFLLFWCVRLERGKPEPSWLAPVLVRTTVAALLVYVVLGVVPTMVSRLPLMLSVEHLEGVQALGTWALLHDPGSLYQPPNVGYSGNIYTPGYYLVSGAWAQVFGLSLPSLRALSLVLLAATAAASAAIAGQLTGRARDGLLWLPLYLLMFDYYGWIDNANKDPLHTALAMGGFAVLAAGLNARGTRTRDMRCVVAGLIWALAFMTKQSHVAAVAPTLLVLLVVARREAWITGISFAVASAALSAASLAVWGETYWLWTFDIPRGHAFSFGRLAHGLLDFAPVGAGYVLIAGHLLWPRAPRAERVFRDGSRETLYAFVAFLLGALATGCLSVGKARGGNYALMPAVAALAVLVSISLVRLRDVRSALLYPTLLFAMTNPLDRWVSERDVRAAERLVSIVAEERGEVWVPFHGWVNVAAGKPPRVALFCIGEWTASGREFPESVLHAVREQRFSLIVGDFNVPVSHPHDDSAEPWATISQYYSAVGTIALDQAFIQEDGWTNVPRILWKPRTVVPAD